MAQSLYEVHTLKRGEWVIDSTYSDKDTAIETAKSLHGEKLFEGIKVIKDTYDPATNSGKEIVVFDTSKTTKNTKKPAAADTAAPAAGGGAKAATGSTGRSRPSNKEAHKQDISVAMKAAISLVVILVFGLGILFGLDYLSKLF